MSDITIEDLRVISWQLDQDDLLERIVRKPTMDELRRIVEERVEE